MKLEKERINSRIKHRALYQRRECCLTTASVLTAHPITKPVLTDSGDCPVCAWLRETRRMR